MNWLIIDFGNTRLKWAQWNDNQLGPENAIEYGCYSLQQLWNQCWGNLTHPQRVIVVSVAEQRANRSLSAWCDETWGIPAEFLHSSAWACGVSNGYQNPSRLGVDRWAALIAVQQRFPGQTVCIADCGTAVTIDALDGNGQHLGGVILPGLNAMRASLQSSTAGINLQESPPISESGDFGRDTESAITLGCLCAITGAMAQTAGKLGKTAESEVICIITGGNAEQLFSCLDGKWQHRPKLVLEGAMILADNNTTTST